MSKWEQESELEGQGRVLDKETLGEVFPRVRYWMSVRVVRFDRHLDLAPCNSYRGCFWTSLDLIATRGKTLILEMGSEHGFRRFALDSPWSGPCLPGNFKDENGFAWAESTPLAGPT